MIAPNRLRFATLILCLAIGACVTPEGMAVHRASKELDCPSEKVAVIQRADISDALYDVAACGQRVRYSCVHTDSVQPDVFAPQSQCVREPDPARWDPDPVMVASLPRPTFVTSDPNANLRRICGEGEYQLADCLYQDHGAWRWRQGRKGGCGYGSTACP